MKKALALVLVLLMAFPILASCGNGSDVVKTGLAVIATMGSSTSADEENEGLAQIDAVIVAVTVDGSGKILDCVIDSSMTKINFDNSGKITSDLEAEQKTKNELGEDYGLKGSSGIGKEWNEQAAALAEYVEGKTISEVKSIALDESGHPTDSDLTSKVTISISDYIDGIEKAVDNAEELGAGADDELGLGTVISVSSSSDATDEEEGLAQAYSNYVLITKDADGKITSCIIDACQANVNFDTTGTITSDTTAVAKTKNELGDDYGMKSSSGIGKEWNEQAAAFAEYAKGKTLTELKSISLDDGGHPTDSDLTSSVTIHVTDFLDAMEKAYN